VVTIFGKTSPLHVREVLQTARQRTWRRSPRVSHASTSLYETARQGSGLRRGTKLFLGFFRRLQRTTRLTRGEAARRRGGRADIVTCATPPADRAGRHRPRSRLVRGRDGQDRNTHPRRLGLGVQRACRNRGRGDARAGHHQRLRERTKLQTLFLTGGEFAIPAFLDAQQGAGGHRCRG